MKSLANNVGRNVVSLRGFPIAEIPEFRVTHGKKVTFNVRMHWPESPWVEVSGTQTVFGLVLHRRVARPNSKPTFYRWTVSEPLSGYAIAFGKSRQDALDDLALRVAFHGGIDAFQVILAKVIARQIMAS